MLTTIDDSCIDGTFNGFVNHYNITKGKIDCAGLDMTGLLERAKEELD
jgi:hypothetical protein